MEAEMRYVYTVYQENSFSLAAKKLFVSQSAVSSMVRKAEERIGFKIFDRDTIPFTLTEEGRFYIKSVEKLMRIEVDMERYFHDRRNLASGHLSIGTSSFYGAYFVLRIIQAFRKKYPGITVNIIDENGERVMEALSNGKIDFSFGSIAPKQENIHQISIAKEHMVLAVPKAFQINETLKKYQLPLDIVQNNAFLEDRFPPVPLNELRDCPFVTLTQKDSDLYQRTIDICSYFGFTPTIAQQFSQIMLAYYAAAAGEGALFTRSSLLSIVRDNPNLVYYKVDAPQIERSIYICYLNSRYISCTMSAFLRFIADLPVSYFI